MNSIIKEFREFFLRNVQVNTGSKSDQESNYPIKYQIGSSQVFNRFIKGNYPSEDVFSKLFNSIVFKLNIEDIATQTVQGLVSIATTNEIINKTDIDANGYQLVIKPSQLSISSGIVKLGSKIGFDMNSTNDQLITLVGGTKFIITDVIVTNASISLNSHSFFLYTQISHGGIFILSGSTAPLTSLDIYISISNQFLAFENNYTITGNSLYASLGTAQGSSSTVDIYVYGYILS